MYECVMLCILCIFHVPVCGESGSVNLGISYLPSLLPFGVPAGICPSPLPKAGVQCYHFVLVLSKGADKVKHPGLLHPLPVHFVGWSSCWSP